MKLYDQYGRILTRVASVSIDEVTDLPVPIADGFLKRNSANTGWQEVTYGTSANTVCQGNDSRLLAAIDRSGRVFSSALPNVGTAITLVSDTAYFTYLGRLAQDLVPKFVEFYVATLG